jgi:hypothetical protein
MAASSSSSTATWDEYKYFKEFTRLVAVKKREATTDKGLWLWDFMHNTLRLSETILVSPYDIDTLILATGDYLTDLFFICSTLRFSAGENHQRNPEYILIYMYDLYKCGCSTGYVFLYIFLAGYFVSATPLLTSPIYDF